MPAGGTAAGELLQEADSPTRHVYFPVDALICLFATCERKPCAEVAMVGREGIVGIELALGIASAPLPAIVQEGGTASARTRRISGPRSSATTTYGPRWTGSCTSACGRWPLPAPACTRTSFRPGSPVGC